MFTVKHIIKVLPTYTIKEADVFKSAAPSEWGVSQWQVWDYENKNFGLASNWDPSKDFIPKEAFASGIGQDEDLRLRKITEHSDHTWSVGVQTGNYFLNDEREYLFSDESLVTYPTDGQNAYLATSPKNSTPIYFQQYSRSSETPDTAAVAKQWKLKTSFTPQISNGVYLPINDDPTILTNVDILKDEAVLIFPCLEPEVKEFSLQVTDNDIVNDYLADGFLEYELTLDWTVTTADTSILYYSPNISLLVEDNICTFIVSQESPPGDYNFGKLLLKNNKPGRIFFNKNINSAYTYTFDTVYPDNNLVGFTEFFPLLDLTTTSVFDITSTVITINGIAWTRVKSLEDYSGDDCPEYTDADKTNIYLGRVYELDSANGKVYFASTEGHVSASGGTAILTGTLTAEIKYEPYRFTPVSTDYVLNANPLFLATRGNYLVLDDDVREPATIILEAIKASDPSFFLSSYNYITYQDTDIYLIATVYDHKGEVIPNKIVEFSAVSEENNSGRLIPSSAITDGNGRAYARYASPYLLADFSINVPLFDSCTFDAYMLTTYGAPPYTDEQTAEGLENWSTLTNAALRAAGLTISPYPLTDSYTLRVNSTNLNIETGLSRIYLFGRFNNDPMQAYNPDTQEGGRLVVWYQEADGIKTLVSPSSATEVGDTYADLTFDVEIPDRAIVAGDPSEENYANLQGYVIIYPLLIDFIATTTNSYGATITSNTKSLSIDLGSISRGVWTLPDPINNVWDGSAISTATYLELNY